MSEIEILEIEITLDHNQDYKPKKLKTRWNNPLRGGYANRNKETGKWYYLPDDEYPGNKRYPVFEDTSSKVKPWIIDSVASSIADDIEKEIDAEILEELNKMAEGNE